MQLKIFLDKTLERNAGKNSSVHVNQPQLRQSPAKQNIVFSWFKSSPMQGYSFV